MYHNITHIFIVSRTRRVSVRSEVKIEPFCYTEESSVDGFAIAETLFRRRFPDSDLYDRWAIVVYFRRFR